MGKKFQNYKIEQSLENSEINQEYLKYVEKIKEKKFLIIEGSKNSRQQLYDSLYSILINNKNKFNIWKIEIDDDSDIDNVWGFIKDGSGIERYFIIENCQKNSNLQSKLLDIINKNHNKLEKKIVLLHSEHNLEYGIWYNLQLSDVEDSNTKQNQKTIRYLLEKDRILNSRINKLINNRVYEKAMEIERRINDLVKKNIEEEIFDPAEIFILLYSIYLHDICELKGISPHRMYDEITSNHKTYFLDEYEAEAIAKICYKADEEIDIYSKYEEFGIPSLNRKIDLEFLIVLFRFGKNIYDVYKEYNEKSKLIRYIDTNTNPIQFQITPKSWNDLVKLILLKEDLQITFEKIGGILNKRKIPEIKIELNTSMQKIAENIKKRIKMNLNDGLKNFQSQVEGWSFSAIQEEGIQEEGIQEEKGLLHGSYYLLFIYYPDNIGIHFEITVSVHENFDYIGIELHMEGENLHAIGGTEEFFKELYKEKGHIGLKESNFRKNSEGYRGVGEWKSGRFFEDKMDNYIAETTARYINKLKPIIDEKYFKKINNQ
jgi:hypothetical protein